MLPATIMTDHFPLILCISKTIILKTRRDVPAVSQIHWRSITEFISLKPQPESMTEIGKMPSRSLAFSGILPPSIMNCSVSAGIHLGPGIGYVT